MLPIEVLKKYWKYESFRSTQEEIINAVLQKKDVLALMPTGGGKSVCFQIPALIMDGICIVITPLIALMKDQKEQLKKRGILAEAIYSGMSGREIDIILDNCIYGNVKFLYVSPERLQTKIMQQRVTKMNVSLLAVDEAHCISQWGYDFRPPYLLIADFKPLVPNASVIALTATATPAVKEDIKEKLSLLDPLVFQKTFARSNLSYSVRIVENKEAKALEILSKIKGSAIIYVRSRKKTVELASLFRKNKFSATFYHAGMTPEERDVSQNNWIRNISNIMVATNAFGMGIDKPDVRVVIHWDLPDTLEAYYQEAGRAGRDEKNAFAVVVTHKGDLDKLEHRIKQSVPDPEYLKTLYQCLGSYLKIAIGSSLLESYDFDIEEFSHLYKLHSQEAYYGLKELENEGLVLLNEGFHEPSKLFIKVDNQQLYKFQISQSRFDPFIKTLLRIYGGEAFTHFVKISEQQISKAIDIKRDEVVKTLLYLEKEGIVEYTLQKTKPQILFLTPRYETSRLPLDKNRIETKRKLIKDKAENVTKYINNIHRCRTQMLLEYFGEITEDTCGNCDACLSKKKKTDTSFNSHRSLILKILAEQPCDVYDVIRKTKVKDQLITDVIRQMLDEGELRYNQEGKLELVKNQ